MCVAFRWHELPHREHGMVYYTVQKNLLNQIKSEMKLTSYGPGKKKYTCIFMVGVEKSYKSFQTCLEMLDFACGVKCLYIDSCSSVVWDWARRHDHRILRCKSWVFA
jgi:hypothetical protein